MTRSSKPSRFDKVIQISRYNRLESASPIPRIETPPSIDAFVALGGSQFGAPGQRNHQQNAGGRSEKSHREPRGLRDLAPNQAARGDASENHRHEDSEPARPNPSGQTKQSRHVEANEDDRPGRAGERGRAHRQNGIARKAEHD